MIDVDTLEMKYVLFWQSILGVTYRRILACSDDHHRRIAGSRSDDTIFASLLKLDESKQACVYNIAW